MQTRKTMNDSKKTVPPSRHSADVVSSPVSFMNVVKFTEAPSESSMTDVRATADDNWFTEPREAEVEAGSVISNPTPLPDIPGHV